MNDTEKRWATIRVRLDPAPREREQLADATDRLEELGAIVAYERDVGGVETRDPDTSAAPSWPELCVYTTVQAVPGVMELIGKLATSLELSLTLHAMEHEGEAWRDAWKQFHCPIIVGQNQLLIRPSWCERRDDDPVVEIVIDPGRAFGTGRHASTMLCLETLCELALDGSRQPRRILDVGCGSGILTLAAARLWDAEELVALDVDPEAVATTAENVADNQLTQRVAAREGVLGSLERVAPFDLVMANIRPDVLTPLAQTLRSVVSPDGALVLSGVLDEESGDVRDAYARAGFVGISARSSEGWTSLLCAGPP